MENLPERATLTPCEVSFDVWVCGCGRTTRAKGCNRVDCPVCKPWLSSRRGHAAFDRLTALHRGEPETVCYTVLTVPEELRPLVAERSIWSRLRKRAWAILRTFGASFGYCATHPVGSMRVCPDCGNAVRYSNRRWCPDCGAPWTTTDGDQFHPHLNILWRPRPGIRGFVDVFRLRTLWREALQIITETAVAEVVVYHQYSGDKKRIMHWSRYVARTFPGWSWWTGPVRWYGRPPTISPRKPCPCPKCGEYPRYVGTVSADAVQRWEKYGFAMGLAPPWEKDDLR